MKLCLQALISLCCFHSSAVEGVFTETQQVAEVRRQKERPQCERFSKIFEKAIEKVMQRVQGQTRVIRRLRVYKALACRTRAECCR